MVAFAYQLFFYLGIYECVKTGFVGNAAVGERLLVKLFGKLGGCETAYAGDSGFELGRYAVKLVFFDG